MSERQPKESRIERLMHFFLDHVYGEVPDHMSDHFRPSNQRDVGKAASEAAGIQLVIEGLQPHHYARLNAPDHLA